MNGFEKLVNDIEKPHPENIGGKFEGMHDYLTHLRTLDLLVREDASKTLFEHIKTHPLPTFRQYYQTVISHASEVRKPLLEAALDRDIAANPGIVEKVEKLIEAVNHAPSDEAFKIAREELKNFLRQSH